MQNELLYLLKATKNQWIVDNVNRGVISIVAIFLCYYIGIAFYTSNEDFTFATAMYFTTQTMTTVGYGDIELMHASSRWFGIVFIITCVLIFATALNNFGIIYGNIMMQRKRAILLTSFTGEKLKALAKSEKGIDKYEFVLEILVETGAIDRDMDVAPLLLVQWEEKFDRYSYLLTKYFLEICRAWFYERWGFKIGGIFS